MSTQQVRHSAYTECVRGTRLRFSRTRLFQLLTCVFAGACLGGCGGHQGPERVVVSGTITYNGKPVSVGRVLFTPVSTSPAPVAGAPIEEGTYRVDGRGGVPVGTHTVQIEAYRTASASAVPGQSESPMARGVRQQYLPKCYNSESQLQITIQSGCREVVKNFELTD